MPDTATAPRYATAYAAPERYADAWALATPAAGGYRLTIAPGIARMTPRRRVAIVTAHYAAHYPERTAAWEDATEAERTDAAAAIFARYAYRAGHVTARPFTIADTATPEATPEARVDIVTADSSRDYAADAVSILPSA